MAVWLAAKCGQQPSTVAAQEGGACHMLSQGPTGSRVVCCQTRGSHPNSVAAPAPVPSSI